MPEVSVIVPIYNVEKYLEKCLDSIINQTLKDIEIICINDCSTDSSLKILQAHAAKDTRIKIMDLIENIGAAPARNKGLENASGKYIYFMDSDDWLDKGYIEELVLNIKKHDTDIVLNGSILYQKDNKLQSFMKEKTENILQSGTILTDTEEIMALPCMAWCRLYKKAFLDKYNIKWLDGITADDYVFHYTTQIYINKIWAYNGKPYYYNYREEGLSQQNLLLREPNALSAVFDYYKEHNLLNKVNFKLFTMYPPFALQNEEQYMAYKKCFVKIQGLYKDTIDKYTDFEKYVFDAVVHTKSFEEFKNKYPSKLFSSFLRQNMIRKPVNA